MIATASIRSLDKNLLTDAVGAQTMSAIVNIGRNKPFTVTTDLKVYMNFGEAGATTALPELLVADYTTIEFTAPDQVVRAAGSWTDDGYTAGRFIVVTGAAEAANNGTFEIETATATDLTTVETTLETEGASTTERINGYQLLEAGDTAVLLPAGTHPFRSSANFESIRFYNPDAVTDANVSVYI